MIHAHAVEVLTRRGTLLEPTTLELRPGTPTLLPVAPQPGHAALPLVLAGRLAPTGGRVELDGRDDPALRRHAVALVDVPSVNEPDAGLPVGTVVGEELALAEQPASPAAVSRWLEGHGVGSRHLLFSELDPDLRTRVLAELAVARPHVRYAVLAEPERHGGDPAAWWSLAHDLADRGLGVLVTVTRPTALAFESGAFDRLAVVDDHQLELL